MLCPCKQHGMARLVIATLKTVIRNGDKKTALPPEAGPPPAASRCPWALPTRHAVLVALNVVRGESIVALTATATRRVEEDVKAMLRMPACRVFRGPVGGGRQRGGFGTAPPPC